MRFSLRIISLVATFAVAVVHGGEEEIDLQAWDGQSELPGGWTQTKLKKSSTYNNGAQFSGAEYSLTSPQFTGTVQTVSVRLTCSADNPVRILKLIPILSGGSAGDPQDFNEPETTGSYEWQVKDIELCGVDRFMIGLNSGSKGNWYVMSVKVTYDETNPVAHPDSADPEPVEDPCLISNCWKMSRFASANGGKYVLDADFSLLGTIKKETDWVNGVGVDSFYSFDDGKPSTRIKVATAASTYHGLYAIHTNDEHGATEALGLLPSGDASMEVLLPVEFDVEQKVRDMILNYRCWQPKIGTRETTLSFSWCAVDSLEAIGKESWISAPEGNYSGGCDDPWKTVAIQRCSFKNTKYICFRWNIPRQSNSSLLGISDLRVTADCSRLGFAVQIR